MATDPLVATAPQADASAEAPPAQEAREQIDPLDFYNDPPTDNAAVDTTPRDDGQPPAEESQPEPIARPRSWGNEHEQKWASLPRESQEFIAQREAESMALITRKTQEASAARKTAEGEAHTAIQQILAHHAQQIDQMWQLASLPPPPDPRLLNSPNVEDQQLYITQKARYDHAATQVAQLQSSAEQTRRQVQSLQSQAEQAAIQADEAKLVEKWPQWSEPSERAKLLAPLQPIAAELGYGPEVQANANSTDLFALDKIRSWKEDADKYRNLMKQRMEPVRAAKQAPPATRVAAPANGSRQPVDTAALLYPNDAPRR